MDPPEEVFPISVLDAVMRKISNPITLTYSLAEGADTDAIISKTCTGLQKLMKEYRFLAGCVHEDSRGNSYSKRTRAMKEERSGEERTRPTERLGKKKKTQTLEKSPRASSPPISV